MNLINFIFLDVKERIRQADITPTIQCKVDAQIFERFSALAEHYKCSNAELLRALIKDCLKRNKDVLSEQ